MKIISLNLENFQGVEKFHLETNNGGDVSVYGDNGAGKSTLYNAFTWLMYGKASTDEKNYTPKTVGTHHLNHIVEMTVELDDGSQLTLKKDFHEVYKTKRGSADPVFAGHTSDYFIDGVPASETDFTARLRDMYRTEELARMLTSYSYFLEDMKIKDRREKLLELCGDVDFDSVVKSDENLKEFPKILKKPGDTDSLYSVEEFQAIAAKEKKLIDKKLKDIPGRIDEVLKARPNTEGLDRKALENKLAELKNTRAEAELSANKDTAEAELRTALAKAKAAYSTAEAEYLEKENAKTQGIRDDIHKLKREADATQAKIDQLSQGLRKIMQNVERMEAERQELLERWTEESSKQWNGSGICPTCGQLFPPQYLERVQAEFNTQKSKKLEAIQEQGKKVSKEVIAAEQKAAEGIDAMISEHMAQLNKTEEKIKALEVQIHPAPLFSSTEEAAKLKADISALEDRLAKGVKPAVDTSITDKLDYMIADIGGQLSMLDMAEKQDERKDELEAEEQQQSAQFEALTHGLYLCDLYSKAKAALLSDKINSHFETLKFRLFIEQQNGGIADDCEALIPVGDKLVPFKSANNAARINAGLEMIDALSEYYGVWMPVYIDNAESNTRIRSTKAQQIRLYVSEGDKALRVVNLRG